MQPELSAQLTLSRPVARLEADRLEALLLMLVHEVRKGVGGFGTHYIVSLPVLDEWEPWHALPQEEA